MDEAGGDDEEEGGDDGDGERGSQDDEGHDVAGTGEGEEREGDAEREGNEGEKTEGTGEYRENEGEKGDVAGNENEDIESGQRSEENVEGVIPVGTCTVEIEEEIVGEDDGEDIPEVQETPEREDEVSDKVVEKRYAAECKRKGKQVAKPLTKKHRQASSTVKINEPTPEPIRVPFAKPLERSDEVSEEEEEAEVNPPEESIYEKTEVLVTKNLLEAMAHFDDPKKALTYEERGAKGKLVKSGKCYHPESLQEIESEEEFLSYISAIGFEWLLDHSTMEVPIALAKEFFTSYKSTMDPDADSITFRLFNDETTMSIREWSMRMGLFTLEEDEEGSWNERAIGP